MTDRLQYILLELPNSVRKANTPEATPMDNFCYALHQMEHLSEQPAELKQEIFRLLFDSAENTKFTPEERAKYQQDMTTERDIHNSLPTRGKKDGKKVSRKGSRKAN